MRIRLAIAAVSLTLVAVAPAGSTLLCAKKNGAVSVRDTACKKHESAVDPSGLGLVGPKGDQGDQGVPGSARAWALVSNDPVLIKSLHVQSVTRVGVGDYCLALDPGFDPTVDLPMAVGEYGYSSGSAGITVPWFDAGGGNSCPSGQFNVKTFDYDGLATNSVGFVFAVL